MEYRSTPTFDRNLKRLRIIDKIKNNIFSDFEQMDSAQASQTPYYRFGNIKKFKKYRKGQYRVFFEYCKECYNKYRNQFNCSFCNGNKLERLVLFNIQNRSEGYD